MQKLNTNQRTLFAALAAVVLQPPPALLATRAQLARRAPSLRPVASLPVPFKRATEWRFIPGAPGARFDWAFMPITADPLYRDRRGYPMPREVIARLRRLRAAGVDFDALWVAHEVERGRLVPGKPLTVDDLLPRFQPEPAAWPRLLARMAAGWLMGMGRNLATQPDAQPATEPVRRPVAPTPAPASVPDAPPVATDAAPMPPCAVPAMPRPAAPCPDAVPMPQPAPTVAPEPPRSPKRSEEDQRLLDRAMILTGGVVNRRKPAPGETPGYRTESRSAAADPDYMTVAETFTIREDGQAVSYDFEHERVRVDPILFGVNARDGVADLYVLGVWRYGD